MKRRRTWPKKPSAALRHMRFNEFKPMTSPENPKLRVLDLFSGIGGFSLGLERAGMETVRFVEIDPFCRRVLSKHWPNVRCDEDITTANFVEGEADVICGGFPCQDVSRVENAPALPDPIQDSTGNWCEPFAWYDQNSRSWKTWQRCLVTGWAMFLGTWPRSGLILSGIAYRRTPSAPLTSGIGSGSLLTPTVSGNYNRKGASKTSGDGLATVLKNLPTPRANKWGIPDSHGSTAAWDQVLPTPRSSDADRGGRGDLLTVLRGYETKHAGTLPTPNARDWRSANPTPHGMHSPNLPEKMAQMGKKSGRMNPRFVEWMMGFPRLWTELEPLGTPSSPKSRS